MAAPSPTARGTPTGIMLERGYSTKITFAANPTVSFWEKSIQPPGVDGGDAIDITTMHSVTWRNMAPASLKTLSECSVTAAYDPNLYNQALDLVNVETTVTITFPDASTLAFYGFLQKIEFSEISEAEFPECTLTIFASNNDPVNSVLAAPVLTSVAGT